MAKRRTLPQDCIVCFSDPCECIKKPEKPKPVPRQRKPKPEPEPTPAPLAAPEPKQSAVAAMKQAAQAGSLDQKKAEIEAARSKTHLSEEDALMVGAVRTLKEVFGEVDGPDMHKYERDLAKPPTPGERAAAWRARRRSS